MMTDSAVISGGLNLFILKDSLTDTSWLEARMSALGYNVLGSACISGQNVVTTDVPPDTILVAAEAINPAFEIAIRVLQETYAPRKLAVIALLSQQKSNYAECYDAVLIQPAHPVQIHNRIIALRRLRRIETALTLRKETLSADFSVHCEQPDKLLTTAFRILFIGSATPDFIAIVNVLQAKNVQVFAAFTSFTAFDYLHDNDFDAVVLNATESLEPALSISATMRGTPRLYDVPTLVMANETQTDIGEAAIQKGARDVFFAGASQYEIAGRILELANFHRIHTALKTNLAEIDSLACLDAGTRLYNRDFLHAHMTRIAAHHAGLQETISMLMIRLRPMSMDRVESAAISAAINQVGSKLKSLVRAEDVVARVSEDVFAVAFPGQARESVERVGQRIKEIIDSAVFDSGDKNCAPLTLEAEFLLSEKMAHEDADRFINRTEQELSGATSGFLVAN